MKKIIITLSTKIVTVVSIFTISTVSNFSLLAQFGGGSGTQADPYQIATKQHLETLADSVENSPSNNAATNYNWSKDKYFIVINDITDSVKNPIGTGATSQSYNSFQGNFNGQNYTIPLAINSINSISTIGLFGKTSGGSIRNVVVIGYVNANNTAWYVGGIVGYISTDTRISNCVNNADIIGGGNSCGGIVGMVHSASIIENCINLGIVRSNGGLIGGIVGIRNASAVSAAATTITNCINYGIVKGNNSVGVGGIIGGITGASNTTISDCINSGIVEGSGGVVGCIVGSNGGGSRTTIINCHYDKQICE